jgi:hypothetical protein
MKITLLGIRHHGVGSARFVNERLRELSPDMIFVESPPETQAVFEWVGTPDLKPPVAILCYDEAEPQRAAFYPFSEFSPEWQALLYAKKHKIPARSLDLPMALMWQTAAENNEKSAATAATTEDDPSFDGDAIGYFSRIAGYDNSELWWEHHFENPSTQQTAANHFEAVSLMMSELRKAQVKSALDTENVAREAYMAQLIRQAQLEMYENIVVVCGAWHVPALENLEETAAAHAKILKTLPKVKIKVGVSWIPWTHERLALKSSYGAGIVSPGWYSHLWKHPEEKGNRWLTKVARLFRDKKMDISTAHVIEAVRLAEALAALRGLPRPSLQEFNEATTTVMCMGDSVLLTLIRENLIVGDKIGKVPDSMPKLPLQADFEAQVKKLRLALTAEKKDIELDLRKPLDLERSIFFHRLLLLKIDWAKPFVVRSKGTFKEAWRLAWKPEILVFVVDKAIWGNTLADATLNFVKNQADTTQEIGRLAELIEAAIPAEVFDAIEYILLKIRALAAVSSDISALMSAVPPLADIGRYGNVRKTDFQEVQKLLEGLTTRICIGLPTACYGLDTETSEMFFERIRTMNEAVRLLENNALTEAWFTALEEIARKDGVHALIRGCTTRLLTDAQKMGNAETAQQFSWALSKGNEAVFSAAWLEGFLKGSGTILIYDNQLWNLVFNWVSTLQEPQFTELLPILRRTFSKFNPVERRQLGEKAKSGLGKIQNPDDVKNAESAHFNSQEAEKSLELLFLMLK